MPVTYKKPGRLNVVSFLFLVAGIAGLYWAVQFGPAYYRRWQAAGVVSDIGNKLYAARMRGPESDAALRQELATRLGELGIDETTVQPAIQKSTTAVDLTVTYREVIRHPLIDKTSTLTFTLHEDFRQSSD